MKPEVCSWYFCHVFSVCLANILSDICCTCFLPQITHTVTLTRFKCSANAWLCDYLTLSNNNATVFSVRPLKVNYAYLSNPKTVKESQTTLSMWSCSQLMFCSCVLQKVRVLQHSSDSVQKPVGPSNDVQKYDAISIFEVLPGCVALYCSFTGVIIIVVIGWSSSACRWWRASPGGCRRQGLQTNFTTCKEDFGKIRVRYWSYYYLLWAMFHDSYECKTIFVYV